MAQLTSEEEKTQDAIASKISCEIFSLNKKKKVFKLKNEDNKYAEYRMDDTENAKNVFKEFNIEETVTTSKDQTIGVGYEIHCDGGKK